MATKPRAVLHIPDPDERDDLPLTPFDPPEQSEVDRVHAMLTQAGGVGRASVRIFKMENG